MYLQDLLEYVTHDILLGKTPTGHQIHAIVEETTNLLTSGQLIPHELVLMLEEIVKPYTEISLEIEADMGKAFAFGNLRTCYELLKHKESIQNG